MTKDKLTFNEADHTYKLNGKEIPSVSQILREEGFYGSLDRVNPIRLENAMENGKAKHYGLQLLDKGELDWSTVDDKVGHCIEEYIRFKSLYKIEIIETENPIYSKLLWVAGTPDRIALVNGIMSVIDFKSGGKYLATRAQLALYLLMWNEMHPKQKIRRRYELNIQGKKDFEFIQYKDEIDITGVQSFCIGRNYKRRIKLWK